MRFAPWTNEKSWKLLIISTFEVSQFFKNSVMWRYGPFWIDISHFSWKNAIFEKLRNFKLGLTLFNFFHSFKVQNASILSCEFVSKKIVGVRALPRALCALESTGNSGFYWFLPIFGLDHQKFLPLNTRVSARAKLFSDMNCPDNADSFCTLNEVKILKTLYYIFKKLSPSGFLGK